LRRFILSRILQAILVMLAVSVIVFFLGRLSGDPTDILLPHDASEESHERLRDHLGLDEPLHVQYWIFLTDTLQGDFGESVKSQRPVMELVKEKWPATLELTGAAIFISLLIALPVGVYSAVRRGGFFDFLARLLAVFGQSIPSFWLGIMLIYIFAVPQFGWAIFPTHGRGEDGLWDHIHHLILPAFTMGWYLSAGIMRLTRSSMLEVLDSDYVKLARIKGVPEYKVIWKHGFKNAALPVLTYSVMIFALVLGGTVITEMVFAWPGMGRMVVDAVYARDFPVVQTTVLLLSAVFVFANLLVDILYSYLNPKIRIAR